MVNSSLFSPCYLNENNAWLMQNVTFKVDWNLSEFTLDKKIGYLCLLPFFSFSFYYPMRLAF